MNIGGIIRGWVGDGQIQEPKKLELQAGQVVKGVVQQQLSEREAIVNIGGVQVRAQLETPLKQGEVTMLQVQPESANGQIVLKPLQSSQVQIADTSMGEVLKTLGMSDTPENRQLVQLLHQNGVALTKESVKAFTELQAAMGKTLPQAEWLPAAVIAVQKGLPLTLETVISLRQVVQGPPLHQMLDQLAETVGRVDTAAKELTPQTRALLEAVKTLLQQVRDAGGAVAQQAGGAAAGGAGAQAQASGAPAGGAGAQTQASAAVAGGAGTQAQAGGVVAGGAGTQAQASAAVAGGAGTQAQAGGVVAGGAGTQTQASGAAAGGAGAQTQASGAAAGGAGAQAQASGAPAGGAGAQTQASGAAAGGAGAQTQAGGAPAGGAGAQAQAGGVVAGGAGTQTQASGAAAGGAGAQTQASGAAAGGAGAQAQASGAPAGGAGAQTQASGAAAGGAGAQTQAGGAVAGGAGAQAQASGAVAGGAGAQAQASGAVAGGAGAQTQASGAVAGGAGAQTQAGGAAAGGAGAPPDAPEHLLGRLMKAIGIEHEHQAVRMLGAEDGRPAGMADKSADSLKSVLMQLAQASDAPDELKQAAQQAVHQITGQQLLLSQDRSSMFSHITMFVPIVQPDGTQTAAIHIQSRKGKNGSLDSNNCRLVFDLQMKALGNTMVDVQVVNRIVSLHVHNDFPHTQALLEQYRDEIGSGLASIGYQFISMKVSPYPEKVSDLGDLSNTGARAAKEAAPGAALGAFAQKPYKGVDIRL